MVLYGYFRSSASYRIRVALHLKNIECEHRSVHLKKGEQNQETFTATNSMSQVPVLIDGDLTLSQSMAILQYLDQKFPEPRLFPAPLTERAQVLQISEIINSGIHPIQNLSVMNYVDEKFAVGMDGKFAWANHWISRGFDGLEKALEKTAGQFAVGDQLSAADLFLVPQVFNARRFKVAMDKYPIIDRIEKSCLQMDAFKKSEPMSQPDAED